MAFGAALHLFPRLSRSVHGSLLDPPLGSSFRWAHRINGGLELFGFGVQRQCMPCRCHHSPGLADFRAPEIGSSVGSACLLEGFRSLAHFSLCLPLV
jgi:hypothetical protein